MDNPKRLFNIYNEKYGTGFAGNVWDKEHISPGLMTMQGGERQPLVEHERERERVMYESANSLLESAGD